MTSSVTLPKQVSEGDHQRVQADHHHGRDPRWHFDPGQRNRTTKAAGRRASQRHEQTHVIIPKSADRATKPLKQPRSAPQHQPPSPAPPEPGDRIWGRPTGGSAARRVAELKQESERWAAGSVGEQQVGRELERLPSKAWWIFHDIPAWAEWNERRPSRHRRRRRIHCQRQRTCGATSTVAEPHTDGERRERELLPGIRLRGERRLATISSANSFAVVARPLLVFVDPPSRSRRCPSYVTGVPPRETLISKLFSHQTTIYTPQPAYAIDSPRPIEPTTWT